MIIWKVLILPRDEKGRRSNDAPTMGRACTIIGMMVAIETLHTLTHWRMEIDANAYCRNNAEWVESQQYDDDY